MPTRPRPHAARRPVRRARTRTGTSGSGVAALLIGALLVGVALLWPADPGVGPVPSPTPSERPASWDASSEGLTYEQDATVIADCLPADYGCLGQAFANLTFLEGVATAHTEIETRMAADVDLRINCHRITHLIGAAAIARFEGDAARAFAEGFRGCGEGYQHGVIARAFEGNVIDTVGEIAAWGGAFCADPAIVGEQGLYLNCLHGLGHGFTTAIDYELYDAIDACRGAFPTPGFAVDQCLNGVFMETFGPVSGVPSPYTKTDNPFAPCDEVDADAARNCWGYAAAHVLSLAEGDFAAAEAECLTLDEGEARRLCVEGVSWEAGVQQRTDPAALLALCAPLGELESNCLESAVHAIAAYEYGADGIAVAVCEAASGNLAIDCYRRLGEATIIEGLTKGEAPEAICARLGNGDEAAVAACGTGVETARASLQP